MHFLIFLFAVVAAAACGPAPASVPASETGGARAERAPQHTNRLIPREEPLPAAARAQSGGLVSLGRRGLREGAPGETSRSSCRIGYSTCHWCHVMERESFENDDGRRGHERALRQHQGGSRRAARRGPDLHDRTCRRLSSGGGWPIVVFLTPDLKPFFGGTYFPPGTIATAARVSGHCLQQVAGAVEDTTQQTRRVGGRRTMPTPGRSQATREPAWFPRRRVCSTRAPGHSELRRAAWRFRRRAEVPASGRARASCSATRPHRHDNEALDMVLHTLR